MPQTFNLTVPDGTDIKDISFIPPLTMWTAWEAQATQATTNLNGLREQFAKLEADNLRLSDTMRERDAKIAELATTNRLQSDKLKDALDRIDTLVKTPPANPVLSEVEKQNTLLQKEFGAAMLYIQGLHEALSDVFAKLPPSSLSPEMRALYDVWRLTKPPVVVVPVPPGPVVVPVTAITATITKVNINNAAIVCIVKDEAPGEPQNEITRQVLKTAQAVGCNMWTGFLNEGEVKTHLAKINDPEDNLIKYGASLGMVFGADTVDAAVNLILDDVRLKAYFDGLAKLGAKLWIVNDADGKLKDGTLRYPPEKLRAIISRIRRATVDCPNIPLMASMTANADPAKVKADYGFDLVEAQTFGSISELTNFFKRDFDVFCLDAQDSASVSYLEKSRPVILADNPAAIRFYAGFDYDGSDWRKMAAQVKELTETVKQWKAGRLKFVAHPA